MTSLMTPRERHLADRADIKLAVEGVDTSDHDAVRACLLRCVAGRLLWRAWENRATMQAAAPEQLALAL